MIRDKWDIDPAIREIYYRNILRPCHLQLLSSMCIDFEISQKKYGRQSYHSV